MNMIRKKFSRCVLLFLIMLCIYLLFLNFPAKAYRIFRSPHKTYWMTIRQEKVNGISDVPKQILAVDKNFLKVFIKSHFGKNNIIFWDTPIDYICWENENRCILFSESEPFKNDLNMPDLQIIVSKQIESNIDTLKKKCLFSLKWAENKFLIITTCGEQK